MTEKESNLEDVVSGSLETMVLLMLKSAESASDDGATREVDICFEGLQKLIRLQNKVKDLTNK